MVSTVRIGTLLVMFQTKLLRTDSFGSVLITIRMNRSILTRFSSVPFWRNSLARLIVMRLMVLYKSFPRIQFQMYRLLVNALGTSKRFRKNSESSLYLQAFTERMYCTFSDKKPIVTPPFWFLSYL